MFDSTDSALEYAYYYTAKNPVRTVSYQKGTNSTNPMDESNYDHIAQAAMILSSLKKLSLYHRYAIELHYTRHQDVIEKVSEWMGIRVSRDLSFPKYFCMDVCRDWSNYGRMKHTFKWWQNHLGKSKQTLWRMSTQKGDSIHTYLDKLDDMAKSQLSDIYRNKKIIE